MPVRRRRGRPAARRRRLGLGLLGPVSGAHPVAGAVWLAGPAGRRAGGRDRGHGRPHRPGRRTRLPASEWRRLLILVGVGATLGLIVQRLVREVRAGSARAEAASYAIGAQQAITEALITAASDAIVSFDRSGAIVSANREAASLFQRADLIGRNVFATLVPPDQLERLQAGFERLVGADVPGQPRDALRGGAGSGPMARGCRSRSPSPGPTARRACSSTRSCAT